MKLKAPQPTQPQATARRRGRGGYLARTRGFTLVEVMIASVIALFVVVGVIGIMLQVGVEQRRGAADALLEQQAGLLQDHMTLTLRSMSAREGAHFTEPVLGAGGTPIGFGRVIVARGTAPDFPREELRWDRSTGAAIHDPDRAQSGNERVVFDSNVSVVLRHLVFSPSIKPDGSPDASLIHVWMEMDDNAWGNRRTATGVATNTVVQRFFSIKMRNH